MTRRVVVVDDSPDVRLTMSLVLRRPDAEIVCVPDGASARDAVFKAPTVAVVMDYRLEDERGTDVIPRLRAEGYDGAVVLFSAHITSELEDQADLLGVGTIAKTEIDDLQAFIDAALGRAASSD